MKYLSIREASEKLNLTSRQVRNLCNSGKIVGAMKVDNFWVIPEDINVVNKKNKDELATKFKSNREIYNLKFNYVIVHGTFGHPGENWFPWLAEEIAKLDKSGKTKREDILIPHFPSSSSADYDSWKSVILGYIDSGIINKNTIFICHSLGPLFISKVLIEKQIKIKGMISVEAAANHLMGNESFDKINSTFFVPSWNYLDNVKKYLDFNYCFYTDNDPHIPFNILKEYIDHAATKSFFIPNSGHFNEASGYKTFPQLLELIKTIELNEFVEEEKIENIANSVNIWNKELSHKWTNMTWPNRPSVSELSIYTKILRKSQTNCKDKKKILILGSNVEFRDWAYEENLDVSIMQDNENYHLATYRELRHKEAPYKIILQNWHNINENNNYDFIVGDQLVSNLGTSNIEPFLKNVSKSLTENGYFFSKTYFKPYNYKKKTMEDIFKDYNENAKNLNPLSYCIFDLTMLCLDKNNFVDFKKIDKLIKDAKNKELISTETYNTLSTIGLSSMSYQFYVPQKEEYETIVQKYFEIEDILYTDDIGSKNFPIYILKKKVEI